MIKKILLSLAALTSVFAGYSSTPLTPYESDSVSAALASVWSEYFAKRAAMSDAASRDAYVAGLRAALSAADSSAAYFQGLEAGVLVNTRLEQVEKMGDFEVDRSRFMAEVEKVFSGKSVQYTPENGNKYMELFMNKRSYRGNDVLVSEAFMDSVAKAEGVIKTPSGLMYQVVTEGEGASPSDEDVALINYVGKLPGGRVFDGTKSGPEEVPLQQVIPGFREGLKLMKPGGKYKLFVPSHLAYGSLGVPHVIPGNSALMFEVELVRVR